MAIFTKGFEFDYMAQRPIYSVLPEWLIGHCKVAEESTVIDLGCGSGLLTSNLLERFQDSAGFRVFAIDPSQFELDIARSRIKDPRVTFIRGTAQDAATLISGDADAVLLCSVLHQIPLSEREAVVQGAFELLKPGGWVGANTTFYEGAAQPESRLFYIQWMTEARRYLERASVQCRFPTRHNAAQQVLTPSQHQDLLASAGFQDIHIEILYLDWQLEDWEALSRYSVFIQGALFPEVDLALGSLALIEGARVAYNSMKISTVRRGVLHCAGRRL